MAESHRNDKGQFLPGPRTHGMYGTRTYRIWRGIWDRCTNPNKKSYPWYGAEGITVCDRWRRFENFLSDMGVCPEGKELDRIDNNGDYEPGNCRWTTRAEQMRNKRDNRRITYDGRTQCLMDWAKETGISFRTLHGRLSRGWPIHDALTIPASRSNPRPKRS